MRHRRRVRAGPSTVDGPARKHGGAAQLEERSASGPPARSPRPQPRPQTMNGGIPSGGFDNEGLEWLRDAVRSTRSPSRCRGGAAASGLPVETVVLDVAVSRGGQPVRGLGAQHFTIVDTGTPRPAQAVLHDSVPLSLVLCFDTSSSLGEDGLQRLREAADRLLESLRPDDQVGLVTPRRWMWESGADDVARRRLARRSARCRRKARRYGAMCCGAQPVEPTHSIRRPAAFRRRDTSS
jgi:hypothetical protein